MFAFSENGGILHHMPHAKNRGSCSLGLLQFCHICLWHALHTQTRTLLALRMEDAPPELLYT